MNARRALDVIGRTMPQLTYDFEAQNALDALAATVVHREKLATACKAIVREGTPHTATQDWPDPALFADWAIEQARAALAKADPSPAH